MIPQRYRTGSSVADRVERPGVKMGDSGTLELVVADDGTVWSDTTRTGLGTRVLADLCTAWDLAHRPDGTTLRATLPVG